MAFSRSFIAIILPCGHFQLALEKRWRSRGLQATSGVIHPPNQKYSHLQSRVLKAVSMYGQAEVLVLLRALAHLSYS